MKTLKGIQKEIANECGEEYFDLLIHTELNDTEDFEQARYLLHLATDRFIDQFIELEENKK